MRAEAAKKSAVLQAEARERTAQADAAATTMVSEAIAKGDINAINYFIAEKYVGALQTIGSSENSKLVLMPLEAAGVMGALGGIGEMVKNITDVQKKGL